MHCAPAFAFKYNVRCDTTLIVRDMSSNNQGHVADGTQYFQDTSIESLGFSLEEPDTRQTTLESAQYRSQGHRPSSFFFCKFAHAPKRFASSIDQPASRVKEICIGGNLQHREEVGHILS